jgi:hypothetical protein
MTYREEMDVYRNSMTPIPDEDQHDPPLDEEGFTYTYFVKGIEGCADCGWTFEGEFVKCEEHKDGD